MPNWNYNACWAKILPVLADFGIAVTECELRHEAMTSTGTLAYMAPEQLGASGRVDPRTDFTGWGSSSTSC